MLSNDILRSVRYILKANNNDLVRILALGNVEATAEQIAVWLRKEDEEGFQRCPDIVLSSFLNGLIYEKRGKDESAPALEPELPRMRRSIFTLFSAWTGSAPACEEKLRRVWRPCETWPPTDYFTSLKPAAFITSSICAIVIPFLASSAETLIPEIPCRALKSTFSISIVTFSCA